MIIFLYGQDTYRAREKLNEIIARYKETQSVGISLSYFNEGDSFEEFKNTASTIPMFDAKKLLVLSDLCSPKDFADSFLSWEGRNRIRDNPDTVCVFIDEAVDKKNGLFKWFLKNAQTQEFKLLEGPALIKWAKKYSSQNGFNIEDAAIIQLVSHTGPDLWALKGEISKAASYKGKNGRVTVRDLELFLKPKLYSHIFSFLDAVTMQDASKAFRFLRSHIESGDNAAQIFSALRSQFRNIAVARHFLNTGRASDMSRKMKLHPFVIKKSISFARNLGDERIKKIYLRIAELERKIKTGDISAEEALEDIILRI